MHSPEEKAGLSDDVFAQVTQQVLEAMQPGLTAVALTVTLCDVDLPAFVVDGELYVQAPLPLIFDAFAAYISDGLSVLETRVSETRSAALASAHLQPTVLEQIVAEQSVVRNGGVG